MKVFLIQQKQLEELNVNKKIVKSSIQRIGVKRWLPLFEVLGEDGNTVTCSLRVQVNEEVRTWADLRLLAEWLRDKLCITECVLYLNDFELPDIGDSDEKSKRSID